MVSQGASTDALQLEALLVARAYLYTLFHKAFGGEPTGELLSILQSDITASVLDEYADGSETLSVLKSFLTGLRMRDQDDLLEQARDEYTRIFVGPMVLPASPYESPYRTMEATLFQKNTLAVRGIFRDRGFLPKAYQHVPDDHVALMCHFAAIGACDALDAFRAGEGERAAEMLRSGNVFLREHLANWLGEYAKGLRCSRTAVLYPQLVEALAAFVDVDAVFADEAAYWLEGDDAITGASGEFAEADNAFESLRALRLPHLSENELATV